MASLPSLLNRKLLGNSDSSKGREEEEEKQAEIRNDLCMLLS